MLNAMRNAPIFCSVELLRTWPPRPEPADGEPCDRSGDATRPVRRGQEIGDIDLSQIDPSAARERVTCPRCEKEVLAEHLESHMTAHSSEPWTSMERPGRKEHIYTREWPHGRLFWG